MDAPTIYRITVEGSLDGGWACWFGGMAIGVAAGRTTLTGPVRDQAALHGLLERIRDLGVVLRSVEVVEAKEQQP